MSATYRHPPRPPSRRPSRATVLLRRALALVAFAVVAGAAAVIVTSLGSGTAQPRGSTTSASGTHRASSSASRASTTTKSRARRRRTPPVVHGPYGVGVSQERLLEPAASSIADTTTSTGATARLLPTTIRYPVVPGSAGAHGGGPRAAAPGPFPLIVFSQGYATSVTAYDGLLDAWTKAGYVVAAPTYPLTDPTAPGGLNESDIVNHPGDLRYVISALVAQAADPAAALYHVIDPSRIAVIGQSDGGDVSLAVAANTCCHDPAVKAAVILSGAELSSFGGSYYAGGSPPLLVTQGDQDGTNLPGCSTTLYNAAPEPKYYVDLLGAAHLPPYVDPGPYRSHVVAATTAFLDYYLKGERARLRALLAAGGVHGVATITDASQVSGTGGTSC